jgi:crotonobetainyl-CoA:carnitine CoA-transferase CaiB-like acyl-CoA transferase
MSGLGHASTVASPIKLSETPAVYRLPPPRLGEHSRQVLQEIGYGANEIDELMLRGVTRQADVVPPSL